MEESTCREIDKHNDALALLKKKADDLLMTFDLLPSDLQMDGLDILQGIVTKTVRKITLGKVSSVKFIPVQENKDSTPPRANKENVSNSEIKEELLSEANQPSYQVEMQSMTGDHLPPAPVSMVDDGPVSPGIMQTALDQVHGEKPLGDDTYTPSTATGGKIVNGNLKKREESLPPLVLSEMTETGQEGKSEVPALPLFVGSGRRAALEAAARLKEDTPSEDGSQLYLDDSSQDLDYQESMDMNGGSDDDKVADPLKKGRSRPSDSKHWRCRYCTYWCDSEAHLSIHQTNVHSAKPNYKRDHYKRKLSTVSSLKKHKLTYNKKKHFECPVCNKRFYTAAQQKIHSVKHTGERLYACSECNKSYTNYPNLRRHQRVHTGEMPYTCDVCEACFRDYSSLKLHKLKHTGEKPYTCEVCSKKFKTSSDYRRHERIHTGERRFECPDCGKMFIQGYNLKQHCKIHTNERPWSCERCNKAFRTKASLQSHTRSHLGIKNFKCQICSKSFSTKMYLRNHQVVHTRAQPYCCTVCGARFNQYSNLRRHALVHSDEKPHACKMCGKQFKYTNSLQYHERTHGGDRTLCQQCGLSFRSETGLHRHHCDPRAYSENLVRTISKHSVVVSLEVLDPHLLRTGKLNEQASLETSYTTEPSTGTTTTDAPEQQSPQPRIVLKINKGKLNRGNLSKRQKVRKGKNKKNRLSKKKEPGPDHAVEVKTEPMMKRKRGRPRKVPLPADVEKQVTVTSQSEASVTSSLVDTEHSLCDVEKRVPPIRIRTEPCSPPATHRGTPVPVQLFSRICIPQDSACRPGWDGEHEAGSPGGGLTGWRSRPAVVIKEEAEERCIHNATGSADRVRSSVTVKVTGFKDENDMELMKAAYSQVN